MWRTRVGYAGGSKEQPTYRAIGDHTECFQVDYDPNVITFEELLVEVWASHDPTRQAYKTQYESVVLSHSDGQLAEARRSAQAVGAALGRPVVTRIEPLGRFWPAEDYHQKYYLRNDRVLMGDFARMFGGDEAAFRESTAAARVNGYVAGDGSAERLAGEIDSLGLSDAGRARLLQRVGAPAMGGCAIR